MAGTITCTEEPPAPLGAEPHWPQTVSEFEELVEAVQDELVHFAFCRLRNRQDAEDAAQEVLVRAYMDREKLRGIVRVRPYLYRMVANRCTDVLRRQKRTAGGDTLLAGLAAPEPVLDRLGEIENLLTRLPKRQAETIRLRVFGGLTFRAISEAAGVSLPTIKSRFRYGVERLRGILTKEAGR
jgi:RNA polymerase sigma-70 factor (ECF subfamily)